jgi:ABC-type sugar transport system ATPase subunit
MARVALEGVRKVYADRGATHVAVHGIDLEIHEGEFVVIVGPSGCGKTTVLRMVAGLEHATAGTIRIGDRIVNDVPARDRDIAMVFQNYALYPHMSVYDNLAFALRLRGQSASVIDTRVHEAAAMLGIEPLLQRKPRQLSGGQQQRVAVGRAIVRQPQVFLYDEPLSNLDAKQRAQTRRELAALRRRLGTTTIYVTHDQVEAMTLGDRIVVMNAGRVQQVGPPLEVYDRPANTFVAGFLGSPPMNQIAGRIVRRDGAWFESAAGAFRLRLNEADVPVMEHMDAVILGIRPEAIRHEAAGEASERMTFDATVEEVEPLGHESLVTVRSGDVALTWRSDAGQPLQVHQTIRCVVSHRGCHWFDGETGVRR